MNVPPQPTLQQVDRDKIYQWIVELASPDTRENALLELRFVKNAQKYGTFWKHGHVFYIAELAYSKKREAVADLAPMLWHSFGTIAALLQEIINIYPAINPPNLTVSSELFYMCRLHEHKDLP